MYKLPRVGLAGMLLAFTLVSCNQKQTSSASQSPAVPKTAAGPTVNRAGVGPLPAATASAPSEENEENKENIVSRMAADLKPEFLMDARHHMPFVSLDMPEMAAASQAQFMHNQEHVLGITGDGESRAYPTRFLAFHHAINDVLGKSPRGRKPVAITYCNVCDSGIRYDPRADGQTLKFDFFGIYNGVVVLCERRTQGVFLMAEGRIVTGPLTGTRLATGPLLDTTWEQWKRLHTDTLVMKPDARFLKYYGLPDQPAHRAYTAFPVPYFGASVTRGDKRLPPFEMVLGVTGPSSSGGTPLHRAYPLAGLERAGDVVNDTLGSKPLAVFMDPHTAATVAVSRQLGARTLTFRARRQADAPDTFYDTQTGTRWNMEGKGEAGPLKGSMLQRLNSHLSRWYGWFASFPDTRIYNRADPPRPGNPF